MQVRNRAPNLSGLGVTDRVTDRRCMGSSGGRDHSPATGWMSFSPGRTLWSMADGRIGPYELIGELGRGGMGVVHAARHVQLGREVAL